MKQELERRDATVLIIGAGGMAFARLAARILDSPWPLLVDQDRGVRRAYGLGRGLAVVNESGTVLVDRDGIVRYASTGLNPWKALDLDELLAVLDAPGTA